MKADLQSVLDWTNRIAASGAMDQWAKRISDGLIYAMEWAKKFAQQMDWREVGATVRDVGVAMWGLATAISAAVRFVTQLNALLRSLPQPPAWIASADNGLRSFLTTPFSEWFKSSPTAPSRATAPSPPTQGRRAVPMSAEQRDRWSRALAAPRSSLAPQSPAAGGKVDVSITLKGSGARDADVGRPKASGPVRASVNRGYAMGGAG